MLVTTYDDVVANPRRFYSTLVDFLGLIRRARDAVPKPLPEKNMAHQRSGPKWPNAKTEVGRMWCSTLGAMAPLYDRWNKALYSMEPELRHFDKCPCEEV